MDEDIAQVENDKPRRFHEGPSLGTGGAKCNASAYAAASHWLRYNEHPSRIVAVESRSGNLMAEHNTEGWYGDGQACRASG